MNEYFRHSSKTSFHLQAEKKKMRNVFTLFVLMCLYFIAATGAPQPGKFADQGDKHEAFPGHEFFLTHWPYCLPQGLTCERRKNHCCSGNCLGGNAPEFGGGQAPKYGNCA